MRRFCLITILMVICVAGLWLPRDGRHPGPRMVSALPRRTHLQATDSPVREDRVRYVRDVSVDPIDEARAVFSYQTLAVMEGERQVGEFVAWYESIPIPTPVPKPLDISSPGPVRGGGGSHSDAWWHGVSICEQGGRNHPYFGFFSVMDGSAGGLSWEQQIVIVNGIISRYGDGAWAAACVAAGYREAPGG